MATLRPMPVEQFGAFVEASVTSHAEDSVASGRWRAEEAEKLARSELSKLLPQGITTPEHFFYEVIAEANGPVVGFVWLGSVPRGTSKVAFLFQIFIQPAYRRQGHGRAALLQVEEWARGLGLPEVALNVAGGNKSAQALYRSLGYAVMSVSMHKPLEPNLVA